MDTAPTSPVIVKVHPADLISDKKRDRDSLPTTPDASGYEDQFSKPVMVLNDAPEELETKSAELVLDSQGVKKSPNSSKPQTQVNGNTASIAEEASTLLRTPATSLNGPTIEKSLPSNPAERSPSMLTSVDPTAPNEQLELPAPAESKPKNNEENATHQASSQRREERRRDRLTPDRHTRTSASGTSSGSRKQLGEWTMGKTLGAGSMGKVKLAISNKTGEKVSLFIHSITIVVLKFCHGV